MKDLERNSMDSSADTTSRPIRVLYVEDDERLARMTKQYMESHNFEVSHIARGDKAVAELAHFNPDVVLLDIMLPGMDGLAVCRAMREKTDVPIILVTARVEDADRVVGLEGGADDYVTKPFSSRELVARIRAQARRARGELAPRGSRVEVGALTLDSASMTATFNGNLLALTTQEFAILRALAERAGRVLSREQLLELSQGTATEAFDRSIDVHISRLRAKLGDDSRHPRILKTIRGLGYLLSPEQA